VALRHLAGGCIDPREFVWTLVEGESEHIGGVYRMYEWGDIDENDPIDSWCVREVHPVLADGVNSGGRQAVRLLVYEKEEGRKVYDIEVRAVDHSIAISWNKNESQDTLSVVTASSNADWAKLEISSAVSGRFSLNDGPSLQIGASPVQMASNTDSIRAGDQLEFCRNGAGGIFQIEIRAASTQQMVKQETFTAAQC
jgi:hypothetical protein